MSLSAFDPLTRRKEKSRLQDRSPREPEAQEPTIALTSLEQILVDV
jgi:hypothetical protein